MVNNRSNLQRRRSAKTSPKYQIASFRTKRYKLVTKEIARLTTIYKESKRTKDKLMKVYAEHALCSLAYFDRKDIRSFLWKYIRFNKIVLNTDITLHIDYIISEYEHMVLNKGPIRSLSFFKELYGIALRIASSNTFTCPEFTKRNSRGEPRILGPLLELLHGDYEKRRAALASLQILKLVGQWPLDFSIDTIVQAPVLEPLQYTQQCWVGNYFTRLNEAGRFAQCNLDFRKLRQHWAEVLEEMFPSRLKDKRIEIIKSMSHVHVSGKNGPNGPCLTTVVLDHFSMTPGGMPSEMLKTIQSISSMTDNKDLDVILFNFDDEIYEIETPKSKGIPINSKISLKRESWGRLRPFAICDWLSHSSLRGFHDYLYRYLDKLPEDGTYRQDESSEAVRKWTEVQPDVYTSVESADLSAATDSIPLEIQTEIVEKIFNPAFAKAWRRLMSERDFKIPDSQETVRYRRGQPMGMSSSWPMLAIWHHAVTRTAMKYLGVERDVECPHYYVIGDDIALRGTELFDIYNQIVQNLLGVGISKSKGYHSDTRTLTNPLPGYDKSQFSHVAELAKRVYINGKELTVIPPDEVQTSLEDPSQFKELLYSLERRGYKELDLVNEIPTLTSLSRDKKLALLLCTNPMDYAPPFKGEGNISLKDVVPYNKLFWNTTNLSLEELNKKFFKEVRGTLIATLAKAVGLINRWIERYSRDGSVKVKGWEYTCETQAVVLHFVTQRCKAMTDNALKRLDETQLLQEGDPSKWKTLMQEIKSLQVIFDIELAFEGKFDVKDQKHYVSHFVSKVIKSMIKDQNN